MTAADLIDRLERLGAAVVVADGKPALRLPPGVRLHGETRRALDFYRAEVLAHFRRDESPEAEHPGRTCRECKALVFTDDADDVFRLCRRVMCPSWRADLASSPEWMARARRDFEWRLRQQKEQAKRDADPVPD